MKNLRISRKLFTGFAIVIALTLILGALSFVFLNSLDKSYTDSFAQNVTPLDEIFGIVENSQKLRVYVRNALLMKNGSPEYEKSISDFNATVQELQLSLDRYEALLQYIRNQTIKDTFNNAKQMFKGTVLPAYEEIIGFIKAEKNDEAASALFTLTSQNDTMLNSFSDILSTHISEGAKNSDQNSETTNMFMIVSTAIAALAVVVAIIVGTYISRLISRPLKEMVNAADSIAIGNVDVQLSYESKDELGMLEQSFNRMIGAIKEQVTVIEALAAGDMSVDISKRSDADVMNISLSEMIATNNEVFSEIRLSADNVSSGASQVAQGSQSLAQGSTEQAAAVQELSSSIAQVAEKTRTNSNKANEASELGTKIKRNAESSNSQMSNMMSAVEAINEASAKISKVIKVIDDIAFQTNILALNAAVEAARAGQHGKGFAVVAEEVRNLAAKSADAAKDTANLIEDSIGKAKSGLTIAKETAASLQQIVEDINRNSDIVQEISRLSDEQASAISQINVGIDQVAQVVQANSATAEESAATSQEMSSQSQILDGLIERFKLKSDNTQGLSRSAGVPPRGNKRPDNNDAPFDGNGFGKY